MDLISREQAIAISKVCYYVAENMEELGVVYEDSLKAMPSAFEGMTCGEVVENMFPNFTFQKAQDEASENKCVLMSDGEHLICDFPLIFWDSPYKGVSE